MKKLFGLILLAGFVSAPGFSQEVEEESNHGWSFNSDIVYVQHGNEQRIDTWFAHSYKLTEDWKLTTRVFTAVSRSRANEDADWGDTQFTNEGAYLHLSGPKLADLGGGWTLGQSYRYYLPWGVDDDSYGRFSARSQFDNTFSAYSVSLRLYGDMFLNRNAYNLNNGKGNQLWGLTAGIINTFTLAEGLSFTYLAFTYARMVGEAQTADTGTTMKFLFEHEAELLYTLTGFYDLNVGVFYYNAHTWTDQPGSSFTYLDKNSDIGLRVSKSF